MESCEVAYVEPLQLEDPKHQITTNISNQQLSVYWNKLKELKRMILNPNDTPEEEVYKSLLSSICLQILGLLYTNRTGRATGGSSISTRDCIRTKKA
jgi:hypothetical protein